MRNVLQLCLVGALGMAAAARAEEAEKKVTYDEHVAPIFRQRCGSCHNPTKRTADLDVTNYVSLMEGGASGAVVEAGDAEASYLFSLVDRSAEPFMPPSSDKIPESEIDLLRRWIDGGALENAGSKPVKPKAKLNLAVQLEPGQRPEVIPLPPRMVLEPFHALPKPAMARSLATSPWAPLAAIASQRQVLLYHTATLELLGVFAFPEGQPNIVRFSRDGRLLLAGGGRPAASGKAIVWDITSGERVAEVGDELDAALAADLSADGQRIVLGGPQRIARVYSVATGELLYEITKHTDWVTAAEFSPDGVLLATADRNGGLHVWEAHTGNEYLTLTGHTASITGLSWRSDSNLLASTSEDATVRLWEPENGTQVKNWNAKSPVLAVEFARDGRLLTSGRDQRARLWDQDGKQLLETAAIGDVAISVTYCDETARAITASWAGVVQVYQTDDGAPQGALVTNPPSLAERLAAAQQQLQEKTAAAEPLIAAAKRAADELAAAKQPLEAAQAEVAAKQEETNKLAAEIKLASDSRAARDAEREKLAASLAQVHAARPLVAEALRHLTEATGKQTDDAQLNELHQQLTAQLAAMEKRATETQAQLTELAETSSEEDARLKELNAQQAELAKQLAAATERVKTTEDAMTRLAAAVASTRQAAEPAEAALSAARQEVARWQDEIAFRDQMMELQKELTTAREVAAAREAELEKAHAQLSVAQSAADAAKAQAEEASRSVDAVHEKIEAARRPR